ncbi:MAG: PH domain-containing protein [Mycobacteriales bacterium]
MDGGSPALHLRVSRIALLAVVFLIFCVTPLAGVHLALLSLYAVPLLVAVWLVRTGTDVDRAGVRVRSLLASCQIPWSQIIGFTVHGRGRLALARSDGVLVVMPLARVRDLDAIRRASGGRLPEDANLPHEATTPP